MLFSRKGRCRKDSFSVADVLGEGWGDKRAERREKSAGLRLKEALRL